MVVARDRWDVESREEWENIHPQVVSLTSLELITQQSAYKYMSTEISKKGF